MNFNSHSSVEGKHALLSPSNYHWINYTDQKLVKRFHAHKLAARGSALHDFAKKAIELKIKISKSHKTLSKYVTDAIDYDMAVEQPLYYSDNCFGTADAISFRRKTLRIHDLKTGIMQTSFHQLEVYAALFCLEYVIDPYSIRMEFRIYQNGEVEVMDGNPDVIAQIMDIIIDFDEKINILKEGGEL